MNGDSSWVYAELQKKHFIAKMGTLKNSGFFGVLEVIIFIQLYSVRISLEHSLYFIKFKGFSEMNI